jgi:predicted Ser/Thr protein kinase
VQSGGTLIVDFDTSFEVYCLTLDGLVAVHMPRGNQLAEGSSTLELFKYGVLYSEPVTDLFFLVDEEKCVDYGIEQWIITEPSNGNFGSISVAVTKTRIVGCVDLSETESLIIGLVVGLGSLLILAGIIILILWKKGKLRKNIRPISQTMMNVLATEKSFLTSVTSLKVEKELGAGSFGKVYVGKWHQTKVAMKFCNVPGKLDEFVQEASLMMKVTPHPNVVQLLAISIDGPEPVIVLEYCDEGALDILLFDTNEKILQEKQIALATGIARGMLHLHKHNLIHRDLAARNILLKQGEPKVSDFGMSRLLQVDATAGKTYGNIGPVRWMAPESLKNGIYSIKSDVWSFGVVLSEIAARSEPHIDQNPLDVGQLIRDRGLTPKLPNDCHPLLRDIMQKCFQVDPEDRPNFDEICEELNAYCTANNINV